MSKLAVLSSSAKSVGSEIIWFIVYTCYRTSGNVWLELILIVALLVYISQGERSTLGATSLGSLSQSGSLSPRRNSRGSLGGSRSSLHRSNESLPMASRSATADAIFMEEFGKGEKEAAAPREGKQQAISVQLVLW